MIKNFLLYTLLFFSNFIVLGQQNNTDYFRSPLDGDIQLSGTFAELRGNHFHSGIDLRTGGKEGLSVYACADGYVARVKIQGGGYGKAIYINHPNGQTTVYAHMQGFSPRIADWIKSQQYKNESFEVDLFPTQDLLTVKKGDKIGSSGNSGSSEGPHLHFEIRDTRTEMPVDPLLLGVPAKDLIRPTLNGLRVYPEGKGSMINGKLTPATLDLAGWGPVYRLKIVDTVYVSGGYSLGVNAFDLLNGSGNKNGIVRYSVFIDSILVFDWHAQRLSFAETRYVNSFIDYPYYYSTNKRFMRTYVAPGNKLGMYAYIPTNGVFAVSNKIKQHVKVVITDSHFNESILRFFVKGKPTNGVKHVSVGGQLFLINTLNNFAAPQMRVSLPGDCLYDSLRFEYTQSSKLPTTLSNIHNVHNPSVPLQGFFELSIKTDSVIVIDPKKLVMVRLNSSNRPSSVGGVYENGFIKASVRDFGRYAVMADTLPPVITPVNVKNGISLANVNSIRFKISDNLSGIKSYRATLNDKWILMDYDPKNRLLTYSRDNLSINGKNTLILTVLDGCGNMSVTQMNLYL